MLHVLRENHIWLQKYLQVPKRHTTTYDFYSLYCLFPTLSSLFPLQKWSVENFMEGYEKEKQVNNKGPLFYS